MSSNSTDPKLRVAVVLGTRPEIIKLGHLVRILGQRAAIIHTGQHFDTSLSQTFFDAFELPSPLAVLDVGGETRGTQIGRSTTAIDAVLREHHFDAVVVQGDTNSALAGALAANACEIPLVHVEAGLRSHDRRMPEEHNRVLIDHLADLCAAPTETSRNNLLAESIPDERISVTGNTVVEAVQFLLPSPERRATILSRLDLEPGRFVLSTFHRPENVDRPETLRGILDELARIPVPVVLPVHPRTAARIQAMEGVALGENLRLVDPVGYEEFLGLSAESAALVSDSGGVQEEASVIKRPVLVVRRSTERPEVLGTFATRMEAHESFSDVVREWLDDLDALHERLSQTPSPYGEGRASEYIAAALDNLQST